MKDRNPELEEIIQYAFQEGFRSGSFAVDFMEAVNRLAASQNVSENERTMIVSFALAVLKEILLKRRDRTFITCVIRLTEKSTGLPSHSGRFVCITSARKTDSVDMEALREKINTAFSSGVDAAFEMDRMATAAARKFFPLLPGLN